MKEQRRHKRFSVDSLQINGRLILANEVNILDISLRGISLRVDKRLNIGNEYALKIGRNNKAISLKGKVIWSRLSDTKENSRGEFIPYYTAGMDFAGISDKVLKELEEFIGEQTRENIDETEEKGRKGTRIHLRFYIGGDEKAVLNLPEHFSVMKMSLGGMLISSALSFEKESRFPMEIFLRDDRTVRFTGRVASCLPLGDEAPGVYGVGIEFLDMPERDRHIVEEFIEEMKAADGASGKLLRM